MLAKLKANDSSCQFTFPEHSIVENDEKVIVIDFERLNDDDTVLMTFDPNLTPMDITGKMFKESYFDVKNNK